MVRLLFKKHFCAVKKELKSMYGVVFGNTRTGVPA